MKDFLVGLFCIIGSLVIIGTPVIMLVLHYYSIR